MMDADERAELIKEAVGFLATSARPSVFTGAGMSAESGIPTYRDQNGLWMNHDPEEVATAASLHHDPARVWEFFRIQRRVIERAVPNAGHLALAQLEAAYFKRLPIITQNIDDLHERANSKSVVHLHGQFMQNRCSRYCQGIPSLVDLSGSEINDATVPLCPHCGAMLRPDVILFGEYLHGYVYERAQAIAQRTDLMLIIGTSGLVAPASKIPLMAQDHGATLIEINPQPSRITPNVDLFIPAPCGEILKSIADTLEAIFKDK
jgi:NAD-dependent deacetylase